ncbi:MAG: sugar transferase [Candidatus Metalachnospira sp.]|nr:sugar transferase [Candidatus Metalachnospira sp.]
MEANQNITEIILTEKQKRYLPIKRAIDIVLSGGAIIVLSPVLVLISLAIRVDSPGPILFKQKRVGKNKELFEILKFRTMCTNTPKDLPTHMLSNPEQYITKIGKFLRKTSIDELPQIFNIFKGQMSIIGPRPALWNQYDLIAERDKYGANDITPGLSGWAQVNGRDSIKIKDKAHLDGEYVKRLSAGFEVKIFILTIINVLNRSGVVEGGMGKINRVKEAREK